jgi:hypothetical protein
MEIEIAGRAARILGARNAIAERVAEALAANGATVAWGEAGQGAGEGASEAAGAAGTPDILVLSHALAPDGAETPEPLAARAEAIAGAMVARGSGRIVHLVSAAGLVPMRRHPAWSAAQAGAIAAMRALAMTCGPAVQVNAVAVGRIEAADATTGDAAMLSHVPLNRPGTPDDIANAVLFLVDPANSYTTGQSLAVDGGWTTGYGRNF